MKQLGVMVSRTDDLISGKKGHYEMLSFTAVKSNMRCIFFRPASIDWQTKQVDGFIYEPHLKQWQRRCSPLPKLIYDRCFSKNRQQYSEHRHAIRQLVRSKHGRLLGQPLPNKWTVYNLLQREPSLRPYIPITKRYAGWQSVATWLRHRSELFLKPQCGSQGRGMLYIKRTGAQFTIIGRNKRNVPFRTTLHSTEAMRSMLHHVTKRRQYVMQQYLVLQTRGHEPFDIRSFIQKNDRGRWQHTAVAMRRGAHDSITANLHGGGKAEALMPYIREVFGKQQAQHLQATIISLSYQIAACLEQHCGRLLELGIDFGIDRSGDIWILEANSKPGRTIFQQLELHELGERSIRMPIAYARFILEWQLGG